MLIASANELNEAHVWLLKPFLTLEPEVWTGMNQCSALTCYTCLIGAFIVEVTSRFPVEKATHIQEKGIFIGPIADKRALSQYP